MFKVEGLNFSYGNQPILTDVSFDITPHKITTLLGANGSGKSTLLSFLAKSKQSNHGSIWLEDQLIGQVKEREFAKKVATLHQNNEIPPEMTVYELVSYGRTPYRHRWQPLKNEDHKQINWALEETGLLPYKEMKLSELSGGWCQLAFIALSLAQATPILLLDEPTTFLDLKYQLKILHLIRKLNKTYNKTIVMVLHDLNHAITFSDEVIGLKAGKVIPLRQVSNITPAHIQQLYDVRLEMIDYDNQKILLTR